MHNPVQDLLDEAGAFPKVTSAISDPVPKLQGVGPNAPIVTNESGGQQSELHYRFDLMPPHALAAVAQILDYGTRVRGYPEWNWLKIPASDHLNHALMHINAHLAGDKQDEHPEHAACRVMMWLEMVIRERAEAQRSILEQGMREGAAKGLFTRDDFRKASDIEAGTGI